MYTHKCHLDAKCKGIQAVSQQLKQGHKSGPGRSALRAGAGAGLEGRPGARGRPTDSSPGDELEAEAEGHLPEEALALAGEVALVATQDPRQLQQRHLDLQPPRQPGLTRGRSGGWWWGWWWWWWGRWRRRWRREKYMRRRRRQAAAVAGLPTPAKDSNRARGGFCLEREIDNRREREGVSLSLSLSLCLCGGCLP